MGPLAAWPSRPMSTSWALSITKSVRPLIYILAGLLLVVTHGQIMLPHRTAVSGAYLSGGGISPTVITNLRYWWVSSDTVTNSPVTNWVDRTQGAITTQSVTGLRP